MLLGSHTVEGLEPMCEVGRPLGHSPVFHRLRHGISHVLIQRITLINRLAHGMIYVSWQHGSHNFVIEDHRAEIVRYSTQIDTPSYY